MNYIRFKNCNIEPHFENHCIMGTKGKKQQRVPKTLLFRNQLSVQHSASVVWKCLYLKEMFLGSSSSN